MHIIFGEALDSIPENYTVLELDTFIVPPDNVKLTSYCVVENLPLNEYQTLDAYKQVHHDLMQAYRDQNWEYCISATTGLIGHWNGELDSFYANLAERVKHYQENPPGDDWTGCVVKTA